MTQELVLMMESDASQLGWGAVCKGVWTGGLWSPVKRLAHINCLELTVAMSAVKGQRQFSRSTEARQWDCSGICKSHGGIHSPQLNDVTTQLCTWCLERGITSSAERIPGVDNCIADLESRTIHSTVELQLHKDIFAALMQEVYQCDVDLFASCLNHQLSQFISWRPDPYAMGTDALKMLWRGYVFPPFVYDQQGPQEDPAPDGPGLGVPVMVSSSAGHAGGLSNPVTNPQQPPFGQHHPLIMAGQLQLAAWTLSSRDTQLTAFQRFCTVVALRMEQGYQHSLLDCREEVVQLQTIWHSF